MLAVVRDTWDYVQQMIPLGLIALMILLLLDRKSTRLNSSHP